MMEGIHTQDIINGTLSISYEAEGKFTWEDEDGDTNEVVEPEMAVLLHTRCCEANHEHIELDKTQAVLLRDWLTSFINGEFTTTEEV